MLVFNVGWGLCCCFHCGVGIVLMFSLWSGDCADVFTVGWGLCCFHRRIGIGLVFSLWGGIVLMFSLWGGIVLMFSLWGGIVLMFSLWGGDCVDVFTVGWGLC